MNQEEKFNYYLNNCTNLSGKSLSNLPSALKETSISCKWIRDKHDSNFTSFYDIKDKSTVDFFLSTLINDSEFMEKEKNSWSYMYTNAIKWYVNLLNAELFFSQSSPKKETKFIKFEEDFKEKELYIRYISAIRTKPFVLLAGISGTGKTKIVRDLAFTCWPLDSEERKAKVPSNYKLIQVRPNWHDSSDLIGYISRISGKSEYVPGDFLKFIAKAWANIDVPHFLCLDEMNLAPVEQYFAEYLSVIETRKLVGDTIKTDPIIEKSGKGWYETLVNEISPNKKVENLFLNEGISIPQNLIVMGTVNMDETTYTFSRKVLDRAMTIEMNEVNLYGGLEEGNETVLEIEASQFLGDSAEGKDVYPDHKEECNIILNYLDEVNLKLDNTPFKIAYRTRNEFLIYAINRLRLQNEEDKDIGLRKAMDEMTSMKILSRIEGDDQKIEVSLFDALKKVINDHILKDDNKINEEDLISVQKIKEMSKKLSSTGFTSFWS
ncbi:MAG: AAA family ATPase [Ruminococcus sp.]|nr:AAA family ATPase [Ruminococcus sp.]